jgi:uncharacterized protein YlaI
MIEVGPADLGYCLVCRKAETVASITIKGWAHRAWVCWSCADTIAGKVEARVNAFDHDIQTNPPGS